MAQKTLLNESEIRRFMKLASIEPLAENGFDKFSDSNAIEEEKHDDDDDKMEEELEVTEMAMDEEEISEEDDEPEMDMPGDEPEMDMAPEPEMDMGDDSPDMGGDDKEDQFMDLVRQLADLVGVEVDMDDGGDDGGAMDVDPVDDLGGEGGDDDMDAAMSPEDEEEVGGK